MSFPILTPFCLCTRDTSPPTSLLFLSGQKRLSLLEPVGRRNNMSDV